MCKCLKKLFSIFKDDDETHYEEEQQEERDPMKKALLVGINKYAPELNADLRGCVNDVKAMRELLLGTYGFEPDNIRVVIDERATKQNIIDRLKWLVAGAQPGDELFFHYSGHGAQVRDRDGDELKDHLDEILCPHDLKWDDPLTDDFIGDLFDDLPAGVNLTMFCDSCHSGTMTRGELLCPTRESHLDWVLPSDTVSINPGDYTQARTMNPPVDIAARFMDSKVNNKRKVGKGKKGEEALNHVLISGCQDNQTSSDAYIDGKYQGAFTWAVTEILKVKPNVTYTKLHEKVLTQLNGKFTQVPNLSGPDNMTSRRVFGGSE